LSENCRDLFERSVLKITEHQRKLLIYANTYKVIFDNEQEIPYHLLDDPEALADWFVSKRNKTQAPPQKKKSGLIAAIKEKGTLNMSQLKNKI
jgi:hypothetical protein